MKNLFIKILIILIIVCSTFNLKTKAFSEKSYMSQKLISQIHRYNTADRIIESLYDIKSNFIGLNENDIKDITPKMYLAKSLKRSKQLANEIFCLRNLFYKFNLSEITKAEARKRVNNITEDVIKYRQGIYQKIMIEKVCLDSKNWHNISNSMNEIRNTTSSIQENIQKIQLNR